VLRLLFLLLAGAALVIWIEPRWSAHERTLALRVRSTGEILDLVRAESRDLGRRAAEEIGERLRNPPVASAPPEAALGPAGEPAERQPEQISHSDRERLDRLIEEKLREE
jgi:hypothetical protein